MNKRVRAVQLLLRAYPGVWRENYGEELVSILEDRPLTLAIIRDVVQNGLLQRARYAEAWRLGGIVLAIWLIIGTTLNSIRAFPPRTYNLFWQIDFCMVLVIGYLSVARDHKTRLASARAAARAQLIGLTPELIIALLWMVGLVHPTILRIDGTPFIAGHWITDLSLRGSDVNISPIHLLIFAPLGGVIPAAIVGAIGAGAAKFVSGFREGLRPGKT